MKKVVLVTYCAFWKHGAGFWARTRELIRYLSPRTDLTVVYVRPFQPADAARLERLDATFQFVPLGNGAPMTRAECINALRALCRARGSADTYIIDKTELSFVLEALPASSCRLVDTHDLISHRALRMKRHNVIAHGAPDEQQERESLLRYDGVICIQAEDYQTVSGWIGADKTILAPHPPRVHRQLLRDEARSVGFVASRWIANVHGLQWFLAEIWPKLYRPELTLDLFGYVCQAFQDDTSPGVCLHGFDASLEDIYASIDVVINPVRFGAGLKIKTVEAMANGLPLVTTAEGARGLAALRDRAFLVADDAPAFAAALQQVIESAALRRQLGENAINYVRDQLSPEACFAQLLARINAS